MSLQLQPLVARRGIDYAQLRWRAGGPLPPRWRPWLLGRDSLTAQLKALSGGQFSVQLLRQAVEPPNRSERAQLNVGPRHWALVREVLLCGHGEPWVFARTVVPLQTLTGPLRKLRSLGTRPLGEQLFAEPSLQRSGFEAADCRRLAIGQPAQWGRRSRFTVGGKPLLVAELFLDTFPIAEPPPATGQRL